MGWFDRLPFGRGRESAKAQRTPLTLASATAGSADASGPLAPASQPRRAPAPPAPPPFPRFHVTAHDQVDPRSTSEAAALRIRFRSAFTPSQPVTDQRMFAGRREILTTLIRSLEDERLHVILYGDRGIGKTSLLHVLAQAARDARYVVAYVSCGASSTFDETFRTIAAEIPLMFHRDYGPTSPEAERGDSFASLLDDTPVSGRRASDLSAKVVDTRVLVVLDEFDRSHDVQFRQDMAEFLKNLSDRSVRLQLIIAGVAANLAELIQNRTAINRNIFAIEAPRMSPEEVEDLVGKGEQISGLSFSKEARALVISVANGLPYSASLLSHHAGLAALAEDRKTVVEDDVSVALDQVILEAYERLSRQAQFHLRGLIRSGANRMLEPLAAISQASGGAFTEDDIQHATGAAGGVERSRALVQKLAAERNIIELVTDDLGSRYRFMDENVPPYLWFLSAQRAYTSRDAEAQTTPANVSAW